MTFVPGVVHTEQALPLMNITLASIGRERASASWHLLAYFPRHVPATIRGRFVQSVAFAVETTVLDDGHVRRPVGRHAGVHRRSQRQNQRLCGSHLAEVMVERGYAASKQEAFETWIGDGLPAFVAVKPTIEEAIRAMKTQVASSWLTGVPTRCRTLRALGVDAVEAVHRSHTDIPPRRRLKPSSRAWA